MKLITPEAGGIPSGAIGRYLRTLEEKGLSTHDIIISRGDNILFEKYYAPFYPDFLHREYSQSKSIVALAVGFATGEGLVNLDDPIGKYFPDETKNIKDPAMAAQTVRQMLMMSTPKRGQYWFTARTDDRVRHYFETTVTTAAPGSEYQYDSTGSFILGAMVERVSGMPLVDYLRPRLFDRIGVSGEIKCLKCPGGHSWGDSAFLAKPRDMMKICRFVLDGGKVNGEQIIPEDYIKDAVKPLISNASEGVRHCSQGYGYQIWHLYGDGFYFNGMGCQFTVAVPEKDIVFVYNGDNQGIPDAGAAIINGFYDIIVSAAGDPLPEDKSANDSLNSCSESLILMSQRGEKFSPIEKDISGRTYALSENPMGIGTLSFEFGESIILNWKNAQGDKTLVIGRAENRFDIFPEEGYSREVGSVYCPGNYYKCASSAVWKDEKTLLCDIQAIDEYFGRLWMTFVFDGDRISVSMSKTAEDFFSTYSGNAEGKLI